MPTDQQAKEERGSSVYTSIQQSNACFASHPDVVQVPANHPVLSGQIFLVVENGLSPLSSSVLERNVFAMETPTLSGSALSKFLLKMQ